MILFFADLVIGFCLFVLFTSIIINFSESYDRKVKLERKSVVETGTMILFFLLFYFLIRFRVGAFDVGVFRVYLVFVGLFMIVLGCVVNILGRFDLGRNWANQIKIYEDQTFVRSGVFGVVRHPLYASLILMYYGACLVYPNYLAFLANTFIFIPFMYYRARQEEEVLLRIFKEYKNYQSDVGMFFPKIFRRFF